LELSFPGGAKGGFPYAGVIMDPAGNLYGTTFLRGRGAYGTGIAYKVDPAGKETVVHTFLVSEGQNPVGAMVRDASGNLYGTTEYGGMNECFSTAGEGCGTAFKIDGTGKETILHEFGSSIDGANPTGDLVMDAAANIYGTTQNGGLFGSGAVFKIDPNGIESILYSFQGPPDGYAPSAGLVIDSAGNLYGTTTFGGANSFFGTVFKIDTTGQETILYSFQNSKDGANPYSKLALDAAGNLYGTTSGGTSTLGTVFKITPQ